MSLLLALSISVDSFAMGISCGMRKIKVSAAAIFVIVLMTLGALAGSCFFGNVLLSYIPAETARIVSSAILILLGAFLLLQALLDNLYCKNMDHKLIRKLRIKSLKIVINIIREPASSDMDNSGDIDIKEALYLGAALSMDALSVGLAAAALITDILLFLLITAVINTLLLKAGELTGKYIESFSHKEKLKFVSGGIVLLVGVLKLI